MWIFVQTSMNFSTFPVTGVVVSLYFCCESIAIVIWMKKVPK